MSNVGLCENLLLTATFLDSPSVHIAKTEDALTCQVESKPEAAIDWLLDGEKINGERKDIKVTTKKGESRLKLVEAQTSRNFTCRATNKYGMKKDHVQVKGKYFNAHFQLKPNQMLFKNTELLNYKHVAMTINFRYQRNRRFPI